MIKYLEGNIFESPAQVIVNTVNTVGVMGKGIALEYKQRYPEMFQKYKSICEKHMLTTGKLMLYYAPDHWILLFPTKENWRNPSKLEYIENGLMKFVSVYAEKSITSIAFPRLGCGNGELDWNDVRPIMEKYLKPLPIDVYIYLRTIREETPEHREAEKTSQWLKQNAKDMSINGVIEDLKYTSAIVPFTFYAETGEEFQMVYRDDLRITSVKSNESFEISEDELLEIWDKIRTSTVYTEEALSQHEKIVSRLLYASGYLSLVNIFEPNQNRMLNGYQLNSGIGRTYSLTGA